MIAHGLWDDRKQAAFDKLEAGQGTADDLIVMNPIKPVICILKYLMLIETLWYLYSIKIVSMLSLNNLLIIIPQLKALYDYMKANDVSIANFESAVKTGLKNAVTFR